jgi:hypothetical protein
MNKWTFRSLGSMVACFSVPSAWSAGAAFAPAGSWLSVGTGIAGVGVVGAGVVLLPRATQCLGRREWFRGGLLLAAWSIAFAAVLYSSVGNVSNIRGDTVEAKSDAIGRYERASADLVRLQSDREAAKHSPLWETSASCTQIDRKSRTFCDHVAGLDREIKANATVVDAGRPGNADPQAATVAWLLHLPQDEVAKASPMLVAAAFEITAMGLFFAAEVEHEESKAPLDQEPPPTENPVTNIEDLEASFRAAFESEQIAKAAAQKAETKREKGREYRLRRKAQLEAAKKPKRRKRKRKPPSTKPPALKLVR